MRTSKWFADKMDDALIVAKHAGKYRFTKMFHAAISRYLTLAECGEFIMDDPYFEYSRHEKIIEDLKSQFDYEQD